MQWEAILPKSAGRERAGPFGVSGKIALITGAAGGIGRALCSCFAENGAKLALLDKSDEVHAVAAGLGVRHKAWVGDVADASTIQRVVAEIADHFGRIDILVNNAGIGIVAPAEALSTSDWDLTLTVNLRAPYLLAREVSQYLIAARYGRIVTIASQAAVIGIEGHVAYSASKAGLLGMTNCLAVEWGPKGITANCISPTVVDTELAKVGWAGEKGERARAEIPTRRFAKPEEIALAALYLASDAAAMINGANLLVDGGYTAR
jgi:NAD(P)-dependent dehydrogenase (short-subunit alcohol dehydrogenase family)